VLFSIRMRRCVNCFRHDFVVQSKKLWDKNFELYSEKISFHQKLRSNFSDVFEKEFKNKKLNICEFKIWRIIEYFLIEKCFKSNSLTIQKVHSTKYYLLLGEWSHKEIYDNENEHTITSIKQILDQIFQNILQSEEIKHEGLRTLIIAGFGNIINKGFDFYIS
jgi:hypothetical protein